MFLIIRSVVLTVLIVVFAVLSACAESSSGEVSKKEEVENNAIADVVASSVQSYMLKVYKSPTCGCCKKWMEHLDLSGLPTRVENSDDLAAVKAQYNISMQYQSCHTAVSEQGYVFEGHVPAKFIKKFLAEQPSSAMGLSVPAMPVGSPGMEMGERFMPYQVLLLKKDGSTEVYAEIENMADQY